MVAKIIPQHVAFLVDQYFLDHSFSSTRSIFRNEASHDLFANSPIQEAPKNLMKLNKMLDEYINLKNHKLMMDQEMITIEQEKKRNSMLFQGMHNVMKAYIVGEKLPPSAAKSTLAVVPQPTISSESSPGMEGKNIPQQVAILVDKYLLHNNFSQTHSTFRVEASSLIREEEKSLMTLDEMLNEYISLKEYKVMMDQEKSILAQEKNKIQNLLHGVHDVLATYNASGNIPPPYAKFVHQPINRNNSHPGVPTFVPNKLNTLSQHPLCNSNPKGRNISTSITYNAIKNLPLPTAKSAFAVAPQPTINSKSSDPGVHTFEPNISNTWSQLLSGNSNTKGRNISTSTVNLSDRKRKETSAMDTPSVAKRSCSSLYPLDGHILLKQFGDFAFKNPMAFQSSAEHCMTRESPIVPSNSPLDTSFVASCNQEAASCSRLISTKKVTHSPANQMDCMQMSDVDSANVPESLNTELSIDEIFSLEFEKEFNSKIR